MKMKSVGIALSLAMVLGLTSFTSAGAVGQDGKDKKSMGEEKKATPRSEYGAAVVYVQRGNGVPGVWALYSVRLGSPVGDTTGGTFRFTCSAANAPCKVSVGAAVLSNDRHAADVGVWPRVIIQKQSLGGGPQTYCEYGDGVDSPSPFGPVTPQASTSSPEYTPLPIHIGGSADCGVPGPAGVVSQIVVPAGYYDVFSSFMFHK